MSDLSKININNTINILNSYNEEELTPSNKAWDLWQKTFFCKLDFHGKDMLYINKFNKFKDDGDYSKLSFDKMFPDLKYDNYINPLSFYSYDLSMKEKQRISMMLQDEISLPWDTIYNVVSYFYQSEKWNYESLCFAAGMVSPQLQHNLHIIDFLASKDIYPNKKVS